MHPKKVIEKLSELPTMPFTIDTMKWNRTGDWRYLTPRVANRPAPCTTNCPAGVPIADYLSAISRGDFQTALALLLSHNPLPGLTGRLCYHPCQTKCLRKKIDEAISIPEIERFMADLPVGAIPKQDRKAEKRVTIVGSGPLGLICAFYLGCWGVAVTVLDGSDRNGGALADLPPHQLEPQVLENEISRLKGISGIHIETGAALDFKMNAPSGAKPDLIIIDPTKGSMDDVTSAEAIAFDPFAIGAIAGSIISVILPENLKTFKASRIAHYIAAGRSMAEKAFSYLLRSQKQDFARQATEDGSEAVAIAGPPDGFLLGLELSIESGAQREDTRERERVLREAERCLSCGTCNLCLHCASSCPDACIGLVDDQTAVAVDLYYCKGCGICAYECPRGVIAMEEIG